jgi:hypothetical protein
MVERTYIMAEKPEYSKNTTYGGALIPIAETHIQLM